MIFVNRNRLPWLKSVRSNLNFYRLHLLSFIVIPLLAACLFYVLNDARTSNQPFVTFTDSLFLCISAATVTGLFTVPLSNLNVGQQIILAVLTALGSYSFVSTITVITRRHYFTEEMRKKAAIRRFQAENEKLAGGDNDAAPTDSQETEKPNLRFQEDSGVRHRISSAAKSGLEPLAVNTAQVRDGDTAQPAMNEGEGERRHSVQWQRVDSTDTPQVRPRGVPLRRTTTYMDRGYGGFPPISYLLQRLWDYLSVRRANSRGVPFTRTLSRLEVPRTQTLQPSGSPITPQHPNVFVKTVSYLTFSATVSKNSIFHGLSEEEMEELGGVELRALNLLAFVVPSYWLFVQLLGFIIIAPYMARAEFRGALTSEDGQAGPVNSTWFSLFQVISSYANNGILIDASLVPLQTAYLLLWVQIVLILAGNTAFPIFLRLCLWLGSKCVPKSSETHKTLLFILDHPRRCFLYLFPSTQTWYLATVLLCLNGMDWFIFLLLDIGNGPISSIPTGIRVMAGLFQAVAVRCGGFQIIVLSTLAPAVQVLYTIMMYVGALPLALSVRSTNVYEDRSIAIYEQGPDDDDDEPVIRLSSGASKVKVWGEYMSWHVRKQLTFDLWWLCIAVFLICIFERGKMLDPSKSSYINVFSFIFEVVSGYGTVGLSLGVPNLNISLSGALGTASKLVLCAVMIRGRHRGLPDAIDRSVLLPNESARQAKMEEEYRQRQSAVREALQSTGQRENRAAGSESIQEV